MVGPNDTVVIRRPRGLRSRVPALDGLRALAVIGVIIFHAFPGALPGGFAGVDVFFVLSGYLITAGLLRRAGNPRPTWGFWAARARRLLPALVLLVLVTGSLVHAAGGDAEVGFGGQLLAGLFFFTNWHLIAAGNSYFAESSPPVFQHLWSLAVEEQFYLLWPLLLWAICRVSPRLRVRASITGGLALASAIWMAALALIGASHLGRAYYGSDSHCFGLLAGATLAIVYSAARRGPVSAYSSALLGTIAALAVAGLVVAFVILDGENTSTYVAGLAAVVVLTLLLIHLTVHDNDLLDRTLGATPLRLIGERSYGLYLWHWPILVLLRNAFPTMAVQHDAVIGVIGVAVTVVIAWASYAWVEKPILRHGLRAWFGMIAAWVRGGDRRTRPAYAAVSGVVVLAAVCLTSIAAFQAPAMSQAQDDVDAGIAAIQAAEQATQTPDATPSATPSAPPKKPKSTKPTTTPSARPSKSPGGSTKLSPAAPSVSGRNITAIGDSVMLASAPALLQKFPGISIDAVVSRQATTAPGIVTQDRQAGRLRQIVLIGLGTNGYLGNGTLAAIRAAAGPDRELVFVNTFVPRVWQNPNNTALVQFVAHDPHSVLVDWKDAISGHLGLLAPDHIHPGPAGGTIYAQTVAAALEEYASQQASPSTASQPHLP